MTIDERPDRLTERHEALTQNVDLLVADECETRHHMIAGLVDVAKSHDRRLNNLEYGSDGSTQ